MTKEHHYCPTCGHIVHKDRIQPRERKPRGARAAEILATFKASGLSITGTARKLGLSRQRVQQIAKKAGLKGNPRRATKVADFQRAFRGITSLDRKRLKAALAYLSLSAKVGYFPNASYLLRHSHPLEQLLRRIHGGLPAFYEWLGLEKRKGGYNNTEVTLVRKETAKEP